MTNVEYLERFGTVTLGLDFMDATIHSSGPSRSVDCTAWIASIPEVYRADALAVALKAAEPFCDGTHKLTQETRWALICAMHAAVCRLTPIPWRL